MTAAAIFIYIINYERLINSWLLYLLKLSVWVCTCVFALTAVKMLYVHICYPNPPKALSHLESDLGEN